MPFTLPESDELLGGGGSRDAVQLVPLRLQARKLRGQRLRRRHLRIHRRSLLLPCNTCVSCIVPLDKAGLALYDQRVASEWDVLLSDLNYHIRNIRYSPFFKLSRAFPVRYHMWI